MGEPAAQRGEPRWRGAPYVIYLDADDTLYADGLRLLASSTRTSTGFTALSPKESKTNVAVVGEVDRFAE